MRQLASSKLLRDVGRPCFKRGGLRLSKAGANASLPQRVCIRSACTATSGARGAGRPSRCRAAGTL